MPGNEAERAQPPQQHVGWGPDDVELPPSLTPAAKPGAPLSDALRERLGQLTVDGSAWMDQNRLAVRLGSAAAVAGSLLFLLHTGHIAGWRQYASLAELPPRLLGPTAKRLPIVVHSVTQRGDALAVRALHYPLLRRLLDRYRRLPPSVAAHRAADRRLLLTCHLAGPLQPTSAGVKYVRQLELAGVHRLRLLSIIDAADQSWTDSHYAATGAQGSISDGQARLQLGPSSVGSRANQGAGKTEEGVPAMAAPAAGQQLPHEAVQHGNDALAITAVPSRSQHQQGEPGTAGRMGTAAASPKPMLWGELYAREPKSGLAALLPRRRVDVGESLISKGDAAMMEPIDLEWLGSSWNRIDRLYAAEQAAFKAGLGIWAVRRPGVGEWSRSVARSAWMRVRHTARTTAASAAGSVGGVAAAAGNAAGNAVAAAGSAAGNAVAAAGNVATAAGSAVAAKALAVKPAVGSTVEKAVAQAQEVLSQGAAVLGKVRRRATDALARQKSDPPVASAPPGESDGAATEAATTKEQLK